MNEYKIGYQACYIHDHNFKMICDIPKDVAFLWAKDFIEEPERWLNKLFVIVNQTLAGTYIAISKHDDYFYLYVKYKNSFL